MMGPPPDYGEESYRGAARLADKKAVITGADSGIGRAVALAFAREGADILVSYYNEHEDARETQRLVESAGRRCLMVSGDIKDANHCHSLIAQAAETFGRIDILVNNAAHQASFDSPEEISDEEWDVTFRTNIHAMNFTGGLAQLLAERGIRVNCVAPGPIWTPLIPSTMPKDKVKNFGNQVPMKRPGQAKELAPVYVMLATDEASYVSGATVAVTGGKPIL